MENQKTNWFSIIFAFFSIILLRNFLEGILEEAHTVTLLTDVYRSLLINFIHFFFFYISLFLSIIITLTLITKESYQKVTRAVALFSPIILIPPIIDIFVSRGVGFNLSYPIEGSHFLHLLLAGPFYKGAIPGITIGMRLEVAIAYILVFLYVCGKRKGILKAIVSIVSLHLLIVIIGDLPLIVSFLSSKNFAAFYGPGSLLSSDTQKFGIIYLLLFTILSTITSSLFFSSFTKVILKSIRYIRTFNYTGAVLIGFLLGYAMLKRFVPFLFSNPWDYLAIFSLFISIFFSFSGAVIINDIYDIKTDIISRKRNPLTLHKIDKKQYLLTALFFFLLGLSFALNTSYTAFFLVLATILISCIYSAPPFRIKRFPLISTFTLAFSTLLCLLIGFSLFAGGTTFSAFPAKLKILILVSLTLGFTPKDIVDVDGDRVNGIYTIPVLFGKRIGKIITYILVCIGYIFVPIIIHSNLILLISLIFTVLTGFEFLLKRVNENLFLITYYLFSSIILLFFLTNPAIITNKNTTKLGLTLKCREYFIHKKYNEVLNSFRDSEEQSEKGLLLAGISEYKLNRLNQAIYKLDAANRSEPYNPDTYSYLTNACVRKEMISEASSVNKRALELWLDLKRFLSEKGIIYYSSDDIKNAELYLNTAYELGYRESSLLFYLAKLKKKKGDIKTAEALLNDILNRNQNNVKILAELGTLKMESKEYIEAIEIYKKALKTSKDNPLFFNNIGVCFLRMGSKERARLFFEKSLKLEPSYVPAIQNLKYLNREER